MQIDAKLLFSDAQTLVDSTPSTIASTNVVDLGPLASGNAPVLGNQGLYLVSRMVTTAVSGGSSTLTVNLTTDSTSAMGSTTLVWTAASAVPKASLTAGAYVVKAQVPLNVTFERYIRLEYVVATAQFTAGSITSYLTTDVESWTAYAREAETFG